MNVAPSEQIKKEKSTILQLYMIFIVSTVFSFYPSEFIQIIAQVFLLALLLGVPLYQWIAKDGSLLENHMIYLNRTIWISTLFFIISFTLFITWVYWQSNSTSLYTLYMQVKSGFMITEDDISGALQEFLNTNLTLLIIASLLCIGPSFAYCGYRIYQALNRSVRGYHMPNPRSWF